MQTLGDIRRIHGRGQESEGWVGFRVDGVRGAVLPDETIETTEEEGSVYLHLQRAKAVLLVRCLLAALPPTDRLEALADSYVDHDALQQGGRDTRDAHIVMWTAADTGLSEENETHGTVYYNVQDRRDEAKRTDGE